MCLNRICPRLQVCNMVQLSLLLTDISCSGHFPQCLWTPPASGHLVMVSVTHTTFLTNHKQTPVLNEETLFFWQPGYLLTGVILNTATVTYRASRKTYHQKVLLKPGLKPPWLNKVKKMLCYITLCYIMSCYVIV